MGISGLEPPHISMGLVQTEEWLDCLKSRSVLTVLLPAGRQGPVFLLLLGVLLGWIFS